MYIRFKLYLNYFELLYNVNKIFDNCLYRCVWMFLKWIVKWMCIKFLLILGYIEVCFIVLELLLFIFSSY